MDLLPFLTKRAVLPDLSGSDPGEVIRALVERVCELHPELARYDLAEAVLAREAQACTAVGGGIALPHALVPGLDRVVGALGRVPAGVTGWARDGQPVRLVALLVAGQGFRDDYLKALAGLARLLQAPRVVDELLRARDRDELVSALLRRARRIATG